MLEILNIQEVAEFTSESGKGSLLDEWHYQRSVLT